MVTPFKGSHAGTAVLSLPTLQQATADPCLRWRLLDTHRQVWVSLVGIPETETELCLSVSCGGTGQQWTAAGQGLWVQ